MKHAAYPEGLSRRQAVEWYRAGRARSKRVFAIPRPEAYYDRPIHLRNPIVFYDGHLPAFAVNTLIKLALQQPGIDEHYEILFARGIDPDSPEAAKSPTDLWPKRHEVEAYGAAADKLIEHALCDGPIDDGAVPQRQRGEAAMAILEHEPMHQETLLYMFHEMQYERKAPCAPLHEAKPPKPSGKHRRGEMCAVRGGKVTLGTSVEEIGFAWDNELPAHEVRVADFHIDRDNVTNGEYLEFVHTGAQPPHFWARREGEWYWRGMFGLLPLPLDAPVYVTQEEADAYARWRGKRLPTEAEYHRAAYSTPSGVERPQPWGDEPPDPTRGNFGFASWDPVPVGSYPAGASAWGVRDLVGNGWEWTSTVFNGFPGFQPMASYPVYSSDFFDGQHYVLKGASPATAPELIRRSFRNWFRGNYPYVYATFRCVA
jgi:formylglycine-generating enzyme required for sulfatase activity